MRSTLRPANRRGRSKTVPDGGRYTITGAPRVVKGMVLIGNGGGEMGMRGYVTAYDALRRQANLALLHRAGGSLEAVREPGPGKGGKNLERRLVEVRRRRPGVGFDGLRPALDLIYIGVGNGAWNRGKLRGDALYLSSIVALKADTGEYVWHYQTTPGDEWDFDACSPMILADLDIGGVKRAVLMQAPKNGFFYVLDRATGQLLSADAFATTTWAKGVDLKTGRPIEVKAARYGESGKPFLSMPGPGGAHSWQPMSFSPATRLVYHARHGSLISTLSGQESAASRACLEYRR